MFHGSPPVTVMRTPTDQAARIVLVAALCLFTGSAIAEGHRNAAMRSALSKTADFTESEKRDLEAGELVVRPSSKRQGDWKLIGGTSWQLIKAPPDEVWSTVVNMGHYRRILPQVMDVKLIRERDRKRTLFIEHGNDLLSICYYLDMSIDADRREVSFRVDPRQRCAVKAGWGYYMIRPHGKDGTVLVYGIMADVGDGIVPTLMRGLIHEWMLKVPWMVKRLVEKRRAKSLSAVAPAPRRSPR